MVQKFQKVSYYVQGTKWAQFEKIFVPFDCSSYIRIWITGRAGGDLLIHDGILKYSNFNYVIAWK